MKRANLLLAPFFLLVAACGQSNSFNGSPPPASPPPPPPPAGNSQMVVTEDNAKPASRVAYKSTMDANNTGGYVGDTGVAGSPGGFQKPGIESSLSGMLTRAIQKVPLGPDVYDCGVSGTQTISGELADIFTLSAGDQINVDATDCDDGLGEVVNGRMEMTIATFSGDLLAGMYLLEVDVLLIDFEVATATDTVLTNGDSTVSIDTTGMPLVAMSISGTSLTNASLTSTETLTGFTTYQTVDTSVMPEPYTLEATGTVDSSQLSGSISYSTPVTFQGAGAAYPYAGEMFIVGANDATIRLIALDEVNVRIETDTDGDGMVDATEDTTWADIAL